MPLYKVARFAEMTGKKPKDIHAYASQHKIVKTKEGFIDTDVTINAAFLLKHGGKKGESDKVESETGMSSVKAGAEDKPKEENENYFLDELRGEHLRLKIQNEKIALEKRYGEVFPIELVKELIKKMSTGLTSTYKQHLEQFLDQLAVKFKIPNADIMKTIKEMSEGLNKAQLENIERVKMEMKAIAKEFGNKRGVGEHD